MTQSLGERDRALGRLDCVEQLKHNRAMIRSVDVWLNVGGLDPRPKARCNQRIVQTCAIVGRTRVHECVPTGIHARTCGMKLSRNVNQRSLRSEPASQPLPGWVRQKLGVRERGTFAMIARVCHSIEVSHDCISLCNVPITSRPSACKRRTRSSSAAWKAILMSEAHHVLERQSLRTGLVRRIHIDQDKETAVDNHRPPFHVQSLEQGRIDRGSQVVDR